MRKQCAECGEQFKPARPEQRFCSRRCYGPSASRRLLGVPKSAAAKAKISGANHYNWKGGVAKIGRFTHAYYDWQHAVFTRDDHTCQHCGYRNTRRRFLHAHHPLSWANHPDSRLDVSNGLTLCRDCHEIHHGRRPSTQPQPCACGCGTEIPAHKVRDKVRFVLGHSKLHITPEAIAKRTAALRGRPKSAEHIAKVTAALARFRITPEQLAERRAAHVASRGRSIEVCDRISATMTGRTKSPETRERMRLAQQKRRATDKIV